MGSITPPSPVILIVAVTYSDESVHDRVMSELVDRYGPVVLSSEPFAFTMTDYYTEEMGDGLFKWLHAFERFIDPGELARIKNVTNELEGMYLRPDGAPGSRSVNIDPGYVSLAKLVLASTKNFSHRIYIGQGIYAEITLSWYHGGFNSHKYTYRDYNTPLVRDFLTSVRGHLKRNGS